MPAVPLPARSRLGGGAAGPRQLGPESSTPSSVAPSPTSSASVLPSTTSPAGGGAAPAPGGGAAPAPGGSAAPAPGGGAAGTGKRVFDVIAEGETVLNDFDITAASGGALKATVVSIPNIEVNDGTLNLAFKAEENFAAISAIEVLRI